MILLVSATSGDAEKRTKVTLKGLELRKNNAVVFLGVANNYVDVALVEVLLGRSGARHRQRTISIRASSQGPTV
jgi:hypothetical protein